MPAATLADVLAKLFGTEAFPRENPTGTTSVGTTAVIALPNNPNRLAGIIINLSANVMYVSPRSVPSASNGFRLGPNGGFIRLVWDEDFSMVGWEWRVMADAAASSLYVLEIVTQLS